MTLRAPTPLSGSVGLCAVHWSESIHDRIHKQYLHTVASLISPVAVWPAQKTSPGIFVAGAENTIVN